MRRCCKEFGESFANGRYVDGHGLGTSGTWTKCSSGSRVRHYLGRAVDQDGVVLDIQFKNAAMAKPPGVSSDAYRLVCTMFRE